MLHTLTRQHDCNPDKQRRKKLQVAQGAGRRFPDHRAGRILRPARPERRRQDHPDFHHRRPDPARRRQRRDPRPRRRHGLPRSAQQARRGAAGTGVRSLLHGARNAAPAVGLLRPEEQRQVDRRGHGKPRPDQQGRRQHARAVGRHEAARAGGAGAGAQAARDRARRADRRRRRRTAPDPVEVHLAPEPRRPHRGADHPLPGRSAGHVPARGHAQARQGGRARHDVAR